MGSTRKTASPGVAPSASSGAAGGGGTGARTGIWVHFSRDADYAQNRRGRCVYCHNYYSCSSGSTGNMWRHIKRSHPEKIPNAAPLATHGQTPSKSEPAAAAAATAASGSDSRPRKRQATSAASPSTVAMERAAMPVPNTLTGRGQAAGSGNTQTTGGGGSGSSLQAARNLEESLLGEVSSAVRAARGDDAEIGDIGSGTEALLLKLLVTLAGRNTAAVERAQMQSSAASLLGVLDGLSALASRSQAAIADSAQSLQQNQQQLGTAQQHTQQQQQQQQAAHVSGDLAMLAARQARTATGGSAGLSESNVAESHRHSTDALAAAILAAVRQGAAEASSGIESAERQQQKMVQAYVDYMVRELVPAERMLAPGMQALMSEIAPAGSAAPTLAQLGAELARQYEQRTAQLRQALADVPGRIAVSIGTGSISSTTAYLAVYAHWVDAGFARRSALLDWRSTAGAATSGDIIAAFEAALAQFDLFRRLGTVTTSYTREFVEFLNQAETICHARGAEFDLDRSQATCIASTLLDAQSTLLSLLYSSAEEGELPPLERLYRVVQRVRRAQGPAARQLVDLYRAHALDLATLEVDETRLWASTLAFVN
ncbi:hypothetical protein FBU59_001923, partial [Linderina macrospora]